MFDRADNKEFLAWLIKPENFAELLVKANGRRIRLDDWQREFLRCESKFINILKSRRVGGSWALTLKMFIRSQLKRNYSGTFISMNLEEAKGKIEYADAIYDSIPRRFRKKRVARSRTELLFEDSRGERSALRSLASRPPRGKGGDIGISELPHCRDAAKIYEGALHSTSRSENDILVIESTPLGADSVFCPISRGKYPGFSLFEVPWWESSALCVNVARAKLEAPKLSTAERVESFGTPSMRLIYGSMPEAAFRQESELEFLDSLSSAFPVDSITGCCTPDYGVTDDADLMFATINGVPTMSDWQWLESRIKGSAFAGYDVGRKKDESALFIFDKTKNGRMEARMLVRLANVDFTSQEKVLCEAVSHGVRRVAIDSTGIGLHLSERLKDSFGERIIPVHFTAESKAKMINLFRVNLMDARLVLPLDRFLISQLISIEQKVTGAGNVIFTVASSSEHHADAAWALLLACLAGMEEGRDEQIVYETLRRRPRYGAEKQISNGWRW